MSKLREKTEARSQLVARMDALLKKADESGEDFTADDLKNYDAWEVQVKDMDAEISTLTKMEERRKAAALEAAKSAPVDKVVEIASEDTPSPTAKVTNERKASKDARNVSTFKLLKGVMSRNSYQIEEARKELAEGGHYDDLLKNKDGSTKSFNTLVDTDGGILIPTSITSEVMDIAQTYGVIPRLANNFGDINKGSIKVPQILGRPSFAAVGEGQEISGSGFNLGAIELKAHKWGTIIPWTNEVSESVAAKLMPIIMDKTAEGYSYAQDDTFFKGDGTSTYNGIQGLETLTGNVDYVRTATAPSGNNTYETLDAVDFLLPIQNVAPGARTGGVYVMHPNMIFILRRLQDGAGNFIYGAPNALAPMGTLWGYPIETSEAFTYDTGTDKVVCAFFNPKYVAYATGRTLSADELREGSIADSSGSTINLARTDQKALRFTGAFDITMSSVTRSTAGTAQGAFSILKTV